MDEQPFDKDDVSKNINTIVALLDAIESSREQINERVKHLKTAYGINPSDTRAAAKALQKQNIEELDEKAKRIQELVDLCL